MPSTRLINNQTGKSKNLQWFHFLRLWISALEGASTRKIASAKIARLGSCDVDFSEPISDRCLNNNQTPEINWSRKCWEKFNGKSKSSRKSKLTSDRVIARPAVLALRPRVLPDDQSRNGDRLSWDSP